jgi:hypothetical protein
MLITLIGLPAFALGYRIKPFAGPSAATIVFVGAGEKKKEIRVAMRRLQQTRMVAGTVPLMAPEVRQPAANHSERLAKPDLN